MGSALRLNVHVCLVVLNLILLVAALAVAQPAAQGPGPAAQTPATATLEIYRPGRFMCKEERIPVFVDDREVGKIQSGRYFTLRLAPGAHVVRGDETLPTQVEVAAGGETFVRFRYDKVGWVCAHDGVGVSVVGADEARRDLAALKPADAQYVYKSELQTAEVSPAPAAPVQAAAPAPTVPPPPPPATLVIISQPANAQVYVDDQFKGMTGNDGRLVVENPSPGSHKLRVDLASFKEWDERVTLVAGEHKTLNVTLDPAGPKPLSLQDVEDALAHGVPKPRIVELVKQYGVDFAYSDTVEKTLRQEGASDEVLLAIATSKR